MPGVGTSEPYFDATGPIAELGYDENHVYYREVDWLTDNEGNVVTIPMQALPEPCHGAPSSTGGQCAGDLDDRLLLADALAAGQHLAGDGN